MMRLYGFSVEIQVELILFLLIFTYMLLVLRGHTPFSRHT